MFSYDIYAYAGMIRDSVRTAAYAKALRRLVRPDSVVLDIGTGIGIWALLASELGARKVYAVDANDAIEIARQIATVNGLAGRIEFIQEFSTRLTLPEKADVLVTDMHGVVPMFEHNLPSIIDARRRLLAPGGAIIPARDTLVVVPVEAAESYDYVAQPWVNRPFDFVWDPALHTACNDWFKIKEKLTPAAYLASPAQWATLDYSTLESPSVIGKADWVATRDGTGHGLLVWFDMLLAEDVELSNAPEQPETIFGQAFFPWSQPVHISAGDTILVRLSCESISNYHLWRWETIINGVTSQGVKADFKQSTFYSMPLSPARLRTLVPTYAPELSEEGEMGRFILSLVDGKNSIENICSLTATEFGSQFDRSDIDEVVAGLVAKYAH